MNVVSLILFGATERCIHNALFSKKNLHHVKQEMLFWAYFRVIKFQGYSQERNPLGWNEC